MDVRSPGVSRPARLAEPDEQITAEELALAARNHGMPMEAMRYDVTPVGLHYLLVHYDIPAADDHDWRIAVTGRVGRPTELTMAELRDRPSRTVRVTMECAGNGRALLRPRPISQPWLVEAVGTAEWTGVPLRDLLADVGIADSAVDVVFTGADHGVERGVEQDYQRSLPVAEALAEDVLVAYEMNGQPLPPQHGFPVRLVVPGWYGMAHVKWLREITVLDREFTGFQNTTAYRLRHDADEPGDPVTRIQPRALIIPPGYPDFMSRTRVVRPGSISLAGRAWSGHAPITRVEIDDGTGWRDATLAPDPGTRWAWRAWSATWDARPGEHILSARATDAHGHTQPVDQPWNRGGFANNLVHRVPVVCLDT
jgi:DMSO/TMAO reductase YedYZ molybdopterin-dependent catalytic subunit